LEYLVAHRKKLIKESYRNMMRGDGQGLSNQVKDQVLKGIMLFIIQQK